MVTRGAPHLHDCPDHQQPHLPRPEHRDRARARRHDPPLGLQHLLPGRLRSDQQLELEQRHPSRPNYPVEISPVSPHGHGHRRRGDCQQEEQSLGRAQGG